MHQHYQNRWTLQQERKSIVNLTEDKKILRQHTAPADNKEYSEATIFWYLFMKLIYEIIAFSLINTLSLYLGFILLGEVLIREQRSKEDAFLFHLESSFCSQDI